MDSSSRKPLLAASAAVVVVAVGALGWLVWSGAREGGREHEHAERPESTDATPVAGSPLPDLTEAVSDGPDAPAAQAFPDLLPAPDGGALRPDAREEAVAGMQRFVDGVTERVQARDWDALRAATDAVRGEPAHHVAVAREMLRTAVPRETLTTGLIFEELVAEGEVDASIRDALGEALVPKLVDGLRGGAYDEDETQEALRLLSRFPGASEAEAELLELVSSSAASPAARRSALFALAEVGTAASFDTVRALLYQDEDPETARIAGLCLFRIARRTGASPEAVASEVGARLSALLEYAAAGPDEASFERIAGSLGELAGLEAPSLLASQVLHGGGFSVTAREQALRAIVGWRAGHLLPVLERLRGQMGDEALEAALAEAIATLRATAPQ